MLVASFGFIKCHLCIKLMSWDADFVKGSSSLERLEICPGAQNIQGLILGFGWFT